MENELRYCRWDRKLWRMPRLLSVVIFFFWQLLRVSILRHAFRPISALLRLPQSLCRSTARTCLQHFKYSLQKGPSFSGGTRLRSISLGKSRKTGSRGVLPKFTKSSYELVARDAFTANEKLSLCRRGPQLVIAVLSYVWQFKGPRNGLF